MIALPKRHCEGLEDLDDEHDPNCQENDHRTAIPVSTLGEERHPPDPQHESVPAAERLTHTAPMSHHSSAAATSTAAMTGESCGRRLKRHLLRLRACNMIAA